MTVRAKFRCTSARKFEGGGIEYEFWAASGPENKVWATATPSASLKITINNPAAQVFEPGKEYFSDFMPAD
jgi:hypothetical protein